MQAVAFGCRYSHHEDKKAPGYLSVPDARKVMDAVGSKEPGERSATIRTFSAPSLCRQEKGAEQWPINTGRLPAEAVAWGMIFGVEDGWFRHDRAGFLQWSELGRERYAAGDSASYVQASGQASFALQALARAKRRTPMSKQTVTIIQIFRAERLVNVEVDAADHESAIEGFQNGGVEVPDFDDPRWTTEWNLQSEDYE